MPIMKHPVRILAVSLALLLPQAASASTWSIDPDHSNIGFSVRHLMLSNVKGNFVKFEGTVDFDDKDFVGSKVSASIDVNSISTNVQKRDEHLRSADFFDVGKFPVMTFISKKWTRSAKGALKVTGDLTLHGVTKTVTLNVQPFSKESKDPWGNIRRATSATAKIRRQDFGLTWNKSLDAGGVMIGDDVDISLEIEMIRAQAH
jgi:polyisoprenoid-binding protein YceI